MHVSQWRCDVICDTSSSISFNNDFIGVDNSRTYFIFFKCFHLSKYKFEEDSKSGKFYPSVNISFTGDTLLCIIVFIYGTERLMQYKNWLNYNSAFKYNDLKFHKRKNTVGKGVKTTTELLWQQQVNHGWVNKFMLV